MGHEDEDAGKAQDVRFEPLHGFQVEMVGRLVEEEDVCPGHQHAGQLGPLAPAAAQFAHGPREGGLREAQARKDGVGAVLGVVPVLVLQFLLAPVQAHQGRVVAGVQGGAPLVPELVPGRQDLQHEVVQGLGQVGPAQLLLHEADLGALGDGNLARIRRNVAGHDLEQRGLAAPVGSDEGEARPGMDLHGQALKEVDAGIGLGNGLNCDFGHFLMDLCVARASGASKRHGSPPARG
ncbi:hypothetical protein DSECCO2_349180 [anaerobic digester metagenome]